MYIIIIFLALTVISVFIPGTLLILKACIIILYLQYSSLYLVKSIPKYIITMRLYDHCLFQFAILRFAIVVLIAN